MRSWENRPDCRVVDEPLYAYFLAETGLDHPGREEIIAAGVVSWPEVVADLTAPAEGVYYQKHMAQHLVPQLPRQWIASLTNVLLIRHPTEVVASYARARGAVTAEDVGLTEQVELYEQLGSVPVIDAADFLLQPEPYLRWLCHFVGVQFLPAMLAWPPGPRPSDGVWAPYWYDSVVASTGFGSHRHPRLNLAAPEQRVVDRLLPLYEKLHAERLVL
jgi:hypothetical protein